MTQNCKKKKKPNKNKILKRDTMRTKGKGKLKAKSEGKEEDCHQTMNKGKFAAFKKLIKFQILELNALKSASSLAINFSFLSKIH